MSWIHLSENFELRKGSSLIQYTHNFDEFGADIRG